MRRYLKNLLMAMLGRNPYQQELDELKEKYEKAGENVQSWQTMYYKAWDNVAAMEAKMKEEDKQIVSLQALVENMRERVREKDAELEEQDKDFRKWMEQTRQEYDKRIATYAEEVERLLKNK